MRRALSSARPPRLTVVLDMDLTLIHAKPIPALPDPAPPARVSKADDPVHISLFIPFSRPHHFQVHKRPGMDDFLERAASKFDLVLFSAGVDQYVNEIRDKCIDPSRKLFSKVFTRSHCEPWLNGAVYLKDVSIVKKPMERIVLVDDLPDSCLYQPHNSILVPSFHHEQVGHEKDQILSELGTFLDEVDQQADVRPFLKECFGLEDILTKHDQFSYFYKNKSNKSKVK